MSKRHQASRRRTYGRRQHEIRERHDRAWQADEVDRDRVEDGFAPGEVAVSERRAPIYGATWLGLE